MDNLTKRKIEILEEPIMKYMSRKYPEKFEKIGEIDTKTLLSKKIFRIISPFLPVIEEDGSFKTFVLPVCYIDHGNISGEHYIYEGIKFFAEDEQKEKYMKSALRVNDVLNNTYGCTNWRTADNIDENLLLTVGTVWEERRNRFFPIALDEGENLMIDIDIRDLKIKDLMNYKLKQIDALKAEALKMKMPEKVADLENGMSSYKFVGSIDRKLAFDIPAERQDYTCFGCGYRPKIVDKHFGSYDREEGRKLEPHRIVHNCFLGDYDTNNVVILCEKCHNLEYKYFKVHWNRFFENGKLMEWNKLIEESFEFFKEYLVWLYLRKQINGNTR